MKGLRKQCLKEYRKQYLISGGIPDGVLVIVHEKMWEKFLAGWYKQDESIKKSSEWIWDDIVGEIPKNKREESVQESLKAHEDIFLKESQKEP